MSLRPARTLDSDSLFRRPDVLIPAEKIGRIVLLLECSQSLVVGPISSPDPTLALLAEVVHIDALLQERLHGAVARAPPRDVVLRRRRLTPCPQDEAAVLCAPVAEGGLPLADSADRPAQVFDCDRRERRGNVGGEEIDEPVDRVVTERAEETALPIVGGARREDLRQQVLDAGVQGRDRRCRRPEGRTAEGVADASRRSRSIRNSRR